MTARYNVFKDSTTQCEEPYAGGQFVGTAQSPAQSKLIAPPFAKHSHGVMNVPNVRRGHDVSNGDKSNGY